MYNINYTHYNFKICTILTTHTTILNDPQPCIEQLDIVTKIDKCTQVYENIFYNYFIYNIFSYASVRLLVLFTISNAHYSLSDVLHCFMSSNDNFSIYIRH